MNITEFLLARITEDEEAARAAVHSGNGVWRAGSWTDRDGDALDQRDIFGDDLRIYDEGGHDEFQATHIARHDPARILAECAAKRSIIVEMIALEHDPRLLTDALISWQYKHWRQWFIRPFAAVYEDHPDYQKHWKS